MAVPVVTQPATPRTIAQGVAIPSLSIVATGSPTSYAASPLPAGLAINTTTGVITGTPTAAGLTETSITATNGDGTSPAVGMVWNVQASPPGRGDATDHEIDFDLKRRLVTIPGVETPESGEVFPVKKGDRFPLLIGLVKDGVLQDLGEDIALKVGIKEIASERLVEIADAAPERVNTDDEARYRVMLRITPAKWRAILGDYEADEESRLIARGELQLQVGAPPELYDETVEVTGLDLFGGIGTGGSGGEPAIEETLVFTGLTATAGASYTLTISLIVAGRSSQNVTVTRTMTLTFTGGVWVVSDLAGDDEGEGASEGTQWRATLTNTAIDGDADSVDVDVEITTTTDSGAVHYVWEIPVYPSGGTLTGTGTLTFATIQTLSLWSDVSSEIGSGEEFALMFDTPEDFLAEVMAQWHSLAGGIEVVSVTALDESTMRIAVDADTAVRFAGFEADDPPDTKHSPVATPGGGTHRTATLSGQLAQDEDADDLPVSISSRNFGIGLGDDIVPDA